jgi:hypothetical protein
VSTTFDLDTITFDSGLVTWDAGIVAATGTLVFHRSGGTRETLPLATLRASAFRYDRQMFRSPYGTVWHQEGDARRLAEELEVSVHVIDDANGISDAALTATTVIAAAEDAVYITSPVGDAIVVALLQYTRQPIESGYRLDFTFATFDGLRV